MAALRCRDAKLASGWRLRVACCGLPKGLRPWRAGHTLLELLAVLSIAAMLAAATLPSLQQLLARQQVREARALQRTLGKMDGVSPSNAAELRALSTRA